MHTTIPFAVPSIGAAEESAVLRVLRSGWLTTGKETLSFEKEFKAVFEDPSLHAIAVSSASAGLHIALKACGVGPGDTVIVPSYTFTSTAAAAHFLGAQAVFVDCTPGTFHIDPVKVEETVDRLLQGYCAYGWRGGFGPKGKPKVLIPVHYGGVCCDMPALIAIAQQYGLKIIEDSAHAFPARVSPGIWAGTYGDIGVFSFYATKTITTGEGGIILCRDGHLAESMSRIRSHGIDRAVWNRYTDVQASWYYEVVEAGYKYNLPDILAALGRVQLSRAFELLEKRRAIAARYTEAFRAHPLVTIPRDSVENAWHLYPLYVHSHRDVWISLLKSKGIGVSVHFIPLHTMPYYKTFCAFLDSDFPHAYENFTHELSLPLWPDMSEEQVSQVIAAVNELT
ncbi:MAG: DegT/DnrJ/EryC1/StrS aminotransferase family protein [Treponema sp.]|jgi:dTDP-4-amino-4,6-dideoxygalactose transaminase|nr:DegT/DnrJ/EryC1/StrS aminotransferase family protein [Treponema sp.]